MPDGLRKVLIVGGYGNFGGRLARLLLDEPGLTLLIAGRSFTKAEDFVHSHESTARLTPCRFDRSADIERQILATGPDIVVDASGPFQAYRDNAYRLPEICIANSIHYLDLADSSKFVSGIASLNAAARKKGVFVLSGLSSCPALTSAVYRYLARGMTSVESVEAGISPAAGAAVGRSVIDAIAGYAGQPIDIRRHGATELAYPFTESMPYTIAPPGDRPLPARIFSLVDVPELTLLPKLQPEPANVWFGAAPVPALYHAMFRVLAGAVKRGLLASLSPMSGLMYLSMNHASWGENRSGMFVDVSGKNAGGQDERRSWHLVAAGNAGPSVPALAAAIVIRDCLHGNGPRPGARAAHAEITLAEFDAMFARLGIVTGERRFPLPTDWSLFRQLLGDAWRDLPKAIREVHDADSAAELRGSATVTRGRSLVARTAAQIFGFPKPGEDVAVAVTISRTATGETWTRDFAGHGFASKLFMGRGKSAWLLCEKFGPFCFSMSLVVQGSRLVYAPRHWTFLGIALPKFLMPQGAMYESVKDNRFQFHVEISLPLFGNIVTYSGWLAPVSGSAS